MILPESVYRLVPGIYIFFGLTTVYSGSEAYFLGRTLLYAGLLLVAGLALVLNGVLIVRARKPNAARRKPARQQSE